jgi:cyclophilin family peptidyl-prolyl cis-trans isomerase
MSPVTRLMFLRGTMKYPKLLLLFLALVAMLVPLMACSSKSTTSLLTTNEPTSSIPAATTSAQVKEWSSPPAMQIDTSKQYTATIDTNVGDIQVQLFANEDPKTVNNFVFLTNQGFYNGCKFFRIVKGFVIQTGDPTNIGTGSPGYQFADEPVTRNYVTGTLAMANSGPNTNGSQFFICLGDLTTLPKSYTIFGIVTSGLDVVQSIGNTPVVANPMMGGEMSSPTQDVHINSIQISEK